MIKRYIAVAIDTCQDGQSSEAEALQQHVARWVGGPESSLLMHCWCVWSIKVPQVCPVNAKSDSAENLGKIIEHHWTISPLFGKRWSWATHVNWWEAGMSDLSWEKCGAMCHRHLDFFVSSNFICWCHSKGLLGDGWGACLLFDVEKTRHLLFVA